jgi:hypothetical protein
MRAVLCFELPQSAFPAIGDPAQAARLADNFEPTTLRHAIHGGERRHVPAPGGCRSGVQAVTAVLTHSEAR